ncbi:hypothetical protein, partial [uncultured Pseudoalteromonas sp.]|uniref:hypothetical protein n=1 Tax=uncultured Pseudoalteromonas sp. TaxID=114053 RepID=UPI002592EA18
FTPISTISKAPWYFPKVEYHGAFLFLKEQCAYNSCDKNDKIKFMMPVFLIIFTILFDHNINIFFRKNMFTPIAHVHSLFNKCATFYTSINIAKAAFA